MMRTYMKENHPDKRKCDDNDEMLVAQTMSLLQEFVRDFDKYTCCLRGKYHPLRLSADRQQTSNTIDRYEVCMICWKHRFGEENISCIHCKRSGNIADSSGNTDVCIPCAGSGFMRVVHVRPRQCRQCENTGIVTKRVSFELDSIPSEHKVVDRETKFETNGHQILCRKTGTIEHMPLTIYWI